MSFAPTVARMLARVGTTWTLRKRAYATGANDWTGGAATDTFTTFTGHARDPRSVELRGGLQQGEFMVTADAASFSAVPAKDDWIAQGSFSAIGTADWVQIVDVSAPLEGGAVRLYKLTARR
jgi:hypothetical protein